MKKKIIILIQSQLNSMGIDAGSVDGILGPRTMGALNQIEGITPQWSDVRKAISFIQLIAQKKGIEAGKIDGYWGPQTDFAFDSLEQIVMEKKEPVIWRPEEGKIQNPNDWPSQRPEENLDKFYGLVGERVVKSGKSEEFRLDACPGSNALISRGVSFPKEVF